ncbi:MAG: TonB-dependent receptor [Pseudomonadota bacterium]
MTNLSLRQPAARAALFACASLLATALATTLATGARAQTTGQTAGQATSEDPDAPDDKPVIVVTGTKQNVGVQDSSESVEIFTAERFDQENLFNASDALARTPGVSIIGDNLNTINIRGISRNGTNGAGQGTAINVFQDGVPIDANLLTAGGATTWDVEQVEVLRGSQSTVQGRNSIAGAVVLQSKKPTFFWEGAARVRVAEFGTVQTSGALSGPILGDTLAFRATVDYSQSDGFIRDGITDQELDFRENLTVRGRLLFEPEFIPGLSALFTLEYQERENGTAQTVVSERGDLDFDFSQRLSFPERIGESQIETTRYIADITQEITDNVTLNLLGSYEETTNVAATPDRAGTDVFAPIGTFTDGVTETWQGEARVGFDFGELTGFIGGYYFDQSVETFGIVNEEIRRFFPQFELLPPESAFGTAFTTFQNVENFAFFTSWRYEPSEKWTIDAALRYDDETFELSRSDPDTFVFPETCVAIAPGFFVGLPTAANVTFPCIAGAATILPPLEPVQSTSLGVFLPSASVTYNITEDASVFAGYRRGYRAGGTLLASSFQTGTFFEVIQFDPEFLNTYEAGWRFQTLDQRLTVNGTFFYSDYTDQQVSFVDEMGLGITDNAGATTLYGLEVTTNYEVSSELDLFGSFSLLDTNVDEFIFVQDDPTTPENEQQDVVGNDLDRSPTLQFTVGLNYENANGLFGGASVNYQSALWSDIFNLDEDLLGPGLTERVEAAAIVNAQIGYEFNENMTFTFFVSNLFDESSPDSINISAANGASGTDDLSDNVLSYSLRQPQSFGASIDLRF